MKAWITKYALTRGIYCIDAEACTVPGMIRRKGKMGSTVYQGEGKEWHRTEKAALAKAEEMRKREISGLEKRIEKLRHMIFEVSPGEKEK